MQKKLSEILIGPYVGLSFSDKPLCEPSNEEIARAVRENRLEERGYQKHIQQLVAEWNRLSNGNPKLYNDYERQYHAQRIAFFVVKGWGNDPIVLRKDGRSMHEGLHRVKAAKYVGLETIDVVIRADLE